MAPFAALRVTIDGRPDSGHRVLLLILGRDFGRYFRRCLGVAVEALTMGAPPVGDGVQRRRVLVELRLGKDGPYLGESPVRLGAEDLSAARAQVAHHVAEDV